jgi:hypothetical protein
MERGKCRVLGYGDLSDEEGACDGSQLPDFLVRSSEVSRQPSANRIAAAPNVGRSRRSTESPITGWRLITSVFLPFALGLLPDFPVSVDQWRDLRSTQI